jgi:hypothetical protein
MTDCMPPATPARRTNYGHTERFDLNCTHTLYGLTCEAYDALRDRAEDACELCRTPDHQTTRGKLIIDHFQGGGLFFVRGLLCDKCNSVMSRHDRTAPWGPASIPYRDRARAYHLNAWDKPTAEEFARADEYIDSHGAYSPGRVPPSVPRIHIPKGKAVVRLDQGPKQIARKLRSYLSDEQRARPVALLTDDV